MGQIASRHPRPTTANPPRGSRWSAVAITGVALVTLALYLSLLHAPFLSWDDDRNISLNPDLIDGAHGRIWSAPRFGLYVPTINSIWSLVYQLGGGSALAFRLFNAIVHVVNVLLVWQLLRTLGHRIRPDSERPATVDLAALCGATVFALHPLQVATVAWISGGRDLAATGLGLLAVIAFLRRGRFTTALATVLFTLGILAKPSIAALPLAVLLCAGFGGRAAFRQALLPMMAWCAIAGVAAVATSAIQTEMTGLTFPLSDRIFGAVDALGFYVAKIALPVSLSADYGRVPGALATYAPPASVTLVVAGIAVVASALLIRRRATTGAACVSWALLLSPVLGVVPFAYQRISTVADHYAYLPMVAAAAVVALVAAAAIDARKEGRVIVVAAWLGFAAVYAGLSAARTQVWKSDERFFSAMLAANPRSFSALSNLAKAACERGESARGTELTAQALAIEGANPPTLATRAHCLFGAERYAELLAFRRRLAFPAVARALEHDDRAAAALLNSFAGGFFLTGNPDAGVAHLCNALALTPDDRLLLDNLRDVGGVLGRPVNCPQSLTTRPRR